ncbi:Rossmann-like and DUF2520 domain-containing protein [Psychroflexus halocasei]|uniref:DUF2520 domain-containing protein n=1 Tax=Psychroflexus halocasei TaxID=908615 RepID=A0A1H3ZU03_9FLAO|nr:DUF2520 domain-containing protein [Psychroflexus halocasei]SEA26752.1 protein of unknown function [Psychroflexus halocasei]
MRKLILLGTGNVAYHLYHAISSIENWEVVQVYNHREESLSDFNTTTQTTTNLNELVDANLIICCLKDDLIESYFEKLVDKDCLIVHTSGAKTLQKNRKKSGVFYPLQSFSKYKTMDYSKIPFCIEATRADDLKKLENLALSISESVYKINSKKRLQMHLAAVFVNNFSNYMFKLGQDLCIENHIDEAILMPLIEETFEKLKDIKAEEAQTGPARRQDQETINQHLKLLKKDSKKEIYKIISQHIKNDYGEKL